jgi:hypothetical protein
MQRRRHPFCSAAEPGITVFLAFEDIQNTLTVHDATVKARAMRQ